MLKKQLLLTIFLACSVNAFASYNLHGSGRIRLESKNNNDFDRDTDDGTTMIGSRFRFNFSASTSDKWSLFIQPQFTKTSGSTVWVTNSTNTTPQNTSGHLYDTRMDVHQAYIDINLNKKMTFRMGRSEINFGDQLLFGSVGWHNIGRSFDLVQITSKLVGTNKLFISNIKSNGNEDHNIFGTYHSINIKHVKNLDVYYLVSNDSLNDSKVAAYGFRAKSVYGDFDYRLEYTKESVEGATEKTTEFQYDLELGYKLLFAESRVSVDYFSASKKFNQFFPTAHKWLGFADLFKRQNIKGYRFNYIFMPIDKLSISFDFHSFSRADTDVTAYTFGGGSYGSIGKESSMATEYDITCKYNYTNDMSFGTGYSMVTPGDYLKDQGYEDKMSFAWIQVSAKF